MAGDGAYNWVNGATMTENELLQTPLKDEWGFDGVVVSDWRPSDRSRRSAPAGPRDAGARRSVG